MEFLDFTSLTLDEFQQLVPPFEVAFHARMAAWRMDGKPRTARRFAVYQNCPLPTPEDRLLFILVYLKTSAHQAMWSKQNAAWPVCGIPDVLYVDHGSDFTSTHLDQVAADLRFQLVNSWVGRPQGRGKVERLFGTLNTECLAALPGYLSQGQPATPPRLSLPELDAAIGDYFLGNYNNRPHRETGLAPIKAWLGQGWLPRMPESL